MRVRAVLGCRCICSHNAAFRAFLRKIVIPSESRHLNRLVSGFASAFYRANSKKACYPSDGTRAHTHTRSALLTHPTEAVYIITFTVVVLNVDLHSPMVTNKMKKDSWINLVRASLDHSNIPISPDLDELLGRVWERTVTQSLHPPALAANADQTLWQRVRNWVGV